MADIVPPFQLVEKKDLFVKRAFIIHFLPRVKGDCVDPAGCKKYFYPRKCANCQRS